MLAFILVLYCCILWEASYMSEEQKMAESHKRGKEKRKWPKAKEKKGKKNNNKAKGLSKEKKEESTKCLSMPKA